MAYRCESGEVPVERDDLAAVLQGHRRDDRIGNQVPHCVSFLTAPLEQGEMALTWKDWQVMGLGAGGLEERKRIGQRGGDREDPSVGGETEERCPHGHRHRELILTSKKIIEHGRTDG